MSDLLNSDNQAEQEQPQQEQSSEQQPQQEQQPETLFEYKGRKFDEQEAIKKFEHADTFIEEKKQREQELEQRIAELEGKLSQSAKIEEAMEQFKQQQSSQPAGENTTQPEAGVSQDELIQKALEAMKQEQAQMTEKQKREANLRDVHQVASSKYGEGYLDKLVQEAQSKQLDFNSKDEIVDFAATRPSAFKQLFGLSTEQKKQVNPSGGTVRQTQEQKPQGTSFADIANEVASQLGVEDYGRSFHNIQNNTNYKF